LHTFVESRAYRGIRLSARFSCSALVLIPAEHWAELRGLTTREAVVRFAQRIGVAPGIVVGRLEKQRLIAWASNLNRLKRRFRWNHA